MTMEIEKIERELAVVIEMVIEGETKTMIGKVVNVLVTAAKDRPLCWFEIYPLISGIFLPTYLSYAISSLPYSTFIGWYLYEIDDVPIRYHLHHYRAVDIREMMEKYGEVKDVYIPTDYYTRRPRGFAFVEFLNADEALEAVTQLNGNQHSDSKPRPPSPPSLICTVLCTRPIPTPFSSPKYYQFYCYLTGRP